VAKEKGNKKELKETATKALESLVEQFNKLQNEAVEIENRRKEVFNLIQQQQGYLKAFEDLGE
jgi:uncharacterized protein (UPF0335 family)|tara:strand:- start:28761 stop:28949 length:189 start_codon:yes stop_codon:yes gene_type:complete